ncbi:MAG: hypothetical protein K6L81_02580 [Agarilytica sp.]
MPNLVGPTDAAPYSAIGYYGFGGGNVNVTGFTAAASGSSDVLQTRILDFGTNTLVHCIIYEQVGGAGPLSPIGEIDVLPGPSPQNTPLSGVTITAGNVYYLAQWGDVSAVDGAAFVQWSSDSSVVAPDGTTSLASAYSPAPDPLTVGAQDADGQMFWNIDGTLGGAGPNLGLRETFYQDGTGTPVTDKNYNVTVLDSSLNILIPTQVIASASGLIEVDSQALGLLNDVVWLAVRDASEGNPDIAAMLVPVTVIDLDA